ncbi:MAG: hypothetical protein GY774_16690 [Planctomycetes bacterium]|nr:hypothetical protein [Planctomycetota bacterium]
MKNKAECWEKLDRLYNRFNTELGERAAQRIFNIIMQELGDDRITISFAYYKRKIRDRQIRNKFCGGNYGELAQLHDLTEKQIRIIVHSEED